MSKKGLVENLLPGVDKILGIRDKIGAVKAKVFIVTRTWENGEIGHGSFKDEIIPVLPTPYLRDFSQDIRLQPQAGVQQGDLILRDISKKSFDSETSIDTRTNDKGIEKAYKLVSLTTREEKFYHVVSIIEDYLTWDVQLRRIAGEDIWKGLRRP